MSDNQQPPTVREGSTAVELPTRLVSRVETRLPTTRFDSPDEYVAYVLEEVLAQVEADAPSEADENTVDEREVQARLESLGYLE